MLMINEFEGLELGMMSNICLVFISYKLTYFQNIQAFYKYELLNTQKYG